MKRNVRKIPLFEFPLWDKLEKNRVPTLWEFDITARCNNNCTHCYINLAPGDKEAEKKELSLDEIDRIADEAVSMGVLWCLLTGGEPLLRKDFFDIYMKLKKKGLLVSVFTNATLINKDHIELFKSFPPRDIEVSVYGVTQATYERISRKKGTFNQFMRGLHLLRDSGLKIRLKAMALRSNVHEIPAISRFCEKITKDFYRFDPFIHLRLDGNPDRNKEILEERLSPEEIVVLEKAHPERFQALKDLCEKHVPEETGLSDSDLLFQCGAGLDSFNLGYDGTLRLCGSLVHPECVYDLRSGSLRDAWDNFFPRVKKMKIRNALYSKKCGSCRLINLCMHCPAVAHLEEGRLDQHSEHFCRMAESRFQELTK